MLLASLRDSTARSDCARGRLEEAREEPYSVVEHNGSNHFQPWILKPALRKAANAAAAALAARPAEVAPAAAVAGGVQGSASVASGAQEAVADDEAAVEDEEGEWVELDGAPFTAHLVKGGPRTTAPTRSYKIIIPFSDETPIYSRARTCAHTKTGGRVGFRDPSGSHPIRQRPGHSAGWRWNRHAGAD